MKKPIIAALAVLLLCGSSFAQQKEATTTTTETVKVVKHKKKRTIKRQNGTADTLQQEKNVTAKPKISAPRQTATATY